MPPRGAPMDSHSDTPIGPPIVAPASRGASRMLLVVLPLVTLALGVAIGGWVIRPRNATGGSENSPPAAEPYTQRGTVKPEHLQQVSSTTRPRLPRRLTWS